MQQRIKRTFNLQFGVWIVCVFMFKSQALLPKVLFIETRLKDGIQVNGHQVVKVLSVLSGEGIQRVVRTRHGCKIIK